VTPKALEEFLFPLWLPYPLIWADQNGTRPPKPYASLKVRSFGSAPLVSRPVDGIGVQTHHEHRTLRAEINVFGAEAVERAQRLSMQMRTPLNAGRAEELGIGISAVDQVRDLATLLHGSQYEQRALLEFTVHAIGTLDEQVGLIEHVVIDCPPDHKHVISYPNAALPPPTLTE
jgi:hypothetical protein